jgi:hypothetical protein
VPDAVSWQWQIAPQRRAGVPVRMNPGRPDEQALVEDAARQALSHWDERVSHMT